MWEIGFYPGSARRPLPLRLSTHCDTVPHHTAEPDLLTAPLDQDEPGGLYLSLRRAPSRLLARVISGLPGRANPTHQRRLLGQKGAYKEEGHTL